jgi:hypothetical protein
VGAHGLALLFSDIHGQRVACAKRRRSFILNGISFVVRSFVRSLVSALSFCTVQFCCTCAVDKIADYVHK